MLYPRSPNSGVLDQANSAFASISDSLSDASKFQARSPPLPPSLNSSPSRIPKQLWVALWEVNLVGTKNLTSGATEKMCAAPMMCFLGCAILESQFKYFCKRFVLGLRWGVRNAYWRQKGKCTAPYTRSPTAGGSVLGLKPNRLGAGQADDVGLPPDFPDMRRNPTVYIGRYRDSDPFWDADRLSRADGKGSCWTKPQRSDRELLYSLASPKTRAWRTSSMSGMYVIE